MKNVSWEYAFTRQAQREPQVREWLDRLDLRPGECVLDAGCGPGFVSLLAAERVGPEGLVLAVDRSEGALEFLARQQEARGIRQIRRIVADLTRLERLEPPPDAALVTMMLHHADDGRGILRGVARILPPSARAVIADFHPDGPCEVGPAREHRLAPEVVRAWCEEAGVEVVEVCRQSPEHYMLLVRRR